MTICQLYSKGNLTLRAYVDNLLGLYEFNPEIHKDGAVYNTTTDIEGNTSGSESESEIGSTIRH